MDKEAPPPINYVDNPHAPDIFISDASGFFRIDGNVMIALESARVDHSTSPGPINRVVIGRLVMPIPAAQRLALSLFDFLDKQGFNPSKAITPEGTEPS